MQRSVPSSPSLEKIAPAVDQNNLRRQVWKLTGPALVELSLVMLVQMVDMIQVGGLGPWAIASVGLANQPMFLVLAVFMGLSVGTTALVARLTGAGEDRRKISAVVLQSLVITAIVAALLSTAGFCLAPQVARLMGAEIDTQLPTTVYFRIVMAGLIFTSATLVMTAALRGSGDTKTPMFINSAANIINILGNWLLINGIWIFPRMEVAGAATATTFARVVACLITLRLLLSGKQILRLRLSGRFKFDWQIIRRIFRIGLPTALEQLALRLGQVVFVIIVASFGTVVMAAHQVAIQVEGLAFMPAMALQIACTTLVGQALGAKDSRLAEASGWETLRWGLYLMIILSFFFFFGGRYVVMLFSRDPQVIELGAKALKIIAFAQPGLATHFILAGGLRGAGDTVFTLCSTMIGIWVMRICLGFFLAVYLNLGLTGAWAAMAIDMYMRATLIFFRYRSGAWKKIKV